MITFAEIAQVNSEIKTMDIKGKTYSPVQERIIAFRKLYPTGSILTEIVSNENGVCIFKATVGYADVEGNFTVLGIGHAYEKEGSSFINKTSFIENAETSAIGRALGMAGIGIDESVASFEEVANAMTNQIKATKEQVEFLKSKYQGKDLECLLKKQKISKLEDLSMSKANDLIEKLGGML